MNLPAAFKSFIAKEHLFSFNHKLLLAVSGGIDSVVLCELCHQCNFHFSIAHCNFQLRGQESERDEQFVRNLANKYAVEIFVKKFDTEAYAKEHKCSIQVAARELRYAWFRELIDNTELSTVNCHLLTAHHLDDNIETMLMNFFKGTGITGLRGMLPKQGNIVRPLLFAGKESIKEFAEQHQLQWVEDSSNALDKYARNFTRNQLIPFIEQLYPQALQNLAANLQRFRETELVYNETITSIIQKLVEQKGEELHIPIRKLQKTSAPRTILFELLHPLGFSSKQAQEALELMDSETGRYIASATHRVLKHRNWLIIAPLRSAEISHIVIENEGQVEFPNGSLHLKYIMNPLVPEGLLNATIDASDIRFPLILRKWKPGDYFYPLGMRKKKKIARFLIDLKMPATEKEKVWVLEMDKKIIWVVGLRPDDRFKVTAQTKKLLQIEWRPKIA